MSRKLSVNENNSDFLNTFIRLCEEKGTSVTEFMSNFYGVSFKARPASWETKNPTVDLELLKAIAREFNVSYDFLIGGKNYQGSFGNSLSKNEKELLTVFGKLSDSEQQRIIGRCQEVYENSRYCYIKVFDVGAAAGYGIPFSDNDDSFTNKSFPVSAVPYNTDFGVRINGDSMQPDYKNGSVVFVQKTEEVDYGELVIAILNGVPYFKIYNKHGLESINTKYPVIPVGENDNIILVGRVIGVEK